MDDVAGDGMSNIIAILALILTLVSFAVNLGVALMLDAKTRDRERQIERREDRVEKSAAYLGLELASIDVFKYKADRYEAIGWARTVAGPPPGADLRLVEEANSFFYQCLNLFEVASRFRKDRIIVPEVYASWVAWFYETLEFPYFRSQWAAEYRDNYTPELRRIFDAGMLLDWAGTDDNARRKQFYETVGAILECPIISQWRVTVPSAA